jgi:hypothetical protein
MPGQKIFRPPIQWNRRLHIRFVTSTARAEMERRVACGLSAIYHVT